MVIKSMKSDALSNSVAVVSGASSGIGKAIAIELAANGATVCLLGRNSAELEKVTSITRKTASQSFFVNVDLAKDEEIRDAVQYIHKELSCIDILVHSAGVISIGPIESASIDDFDMQYRINVRAPFALTQELLPMIKTNSGKIVFINSSAGLVAGENIGQYAATKFALKAFADSLRHEINSKGISVLSVYPGRTASPMQEAIYKMEGREYHPELLMQPEDVANIVISSIRLPRSAEVTNISVRPLNKSY